MKIKVYDKFAFLWAATKLEDCEQFKHLSPEERAIMIEVLESFLIYYNEGIMVKEAGELGLPKIPQ